MRTRYSPACRKLSTTALTVLALNVLTSACFAAAAAGCGALPPLPETVSLPISETETVEAAIGTGPALLANSVWDITRAADSYEPRPTGYLVGRALSRAVLASRNYAANKRPRTPVLGAGLSADAAANTQARLDYFPRPDVGETIFVVHFGPQGEMIEVTENEYLLPRLYGTEVAIGGRWVPTPLPGVAFRSESYGLADGDRYAVAARFQVRFLACPLATALVYSFGELTGDLSEGKFGYRIDFTNGILPFLGRLQDEYPAMGERIE